MTTTFRSRKYWTAPRYLSHYMIMIPDFMTPTTVALLRVARESIVTNEASCRTPELLSVRPQNSYACFVCGHIHIDAVRHVQEQP